MFKKMLTVSPYKFILLTSIFFLFLGAYNIIISKVSLPEITFCNILLCESMLYFVVLLYFSLLLIIVCFSIFSHFYYYKDFYTSTTFYTKGRAIIYCLLQCSFVITDLQKAIIASKPLNIFPKLKHIHEMFFHEKVFSTLPKNHVYASSIDFRGYDAYSFPRESYDSIKKGDLSSVSLYEYKRISFKPQKFFDTQYRIYTQPFENQDHPKVLKGFRPKAVDLVDIGFFKEEGFIKSQELIRLPKKVTLTDFSSDFIKLVMADQNKVLHQDTILTKECLERLGIFLESYTSNTNMELAKDLNELISPGGPLYGLL